MVAKASTERGAGRGERWGGRSGRGDCCGKSSEAEEGKTAAAAAAGEEEEEEEEEEEPGTTGGAQGRARELEKSILDEERIGDGRSWSRPGRRATCDGGQRGEHKRTKDSKKDEEGTAMRQGLLRARQEASVLDVPDSLTLPAESAEAEAIPNRTRRSTAIWWTSSPVWTAGTTP